MILVVGATGRLGKAATRALLAGGIRVRAASRSAPGADLAPGAEAVRIDLRDPDSFAAALDGVEQVVVAVQALTARRGDSIAKVDVAGHKALIDAAAAAGINRFIYVSAQNADPRHPAAFMRAKADVETYLKQSGLDYRILRPSAFMDLYAHEIIGRPVLAGKKVMLLGDGRTVRNLVAVDDVAAVIVAAVAGRLPDPVVEVVGGSNADDRAIAALYGRLSGQPVRIGSLPAGALGVIAGLIGPFHAGIRNLMLFGGQNAAHGDLTADASHMVGIIGRKAQTLEAFVQARIADQQSARG